MICEITALKKTPMSHKDMTATNSLRTEGTANLIAAARQLGARRFLTQSMVFGYGYGDWGGRVLTEADQFGPPGHGRFEEHLAAMRSNEEQVLRADGLDGIALATAWCTGRARRAIPHRGAAQAQASHRAQLRGAALGLRRRRRRRDRRRAGAGHAGHGL